MHHISKILADRINEETELKKNLHSYLKCRRKIPKDFKLKLTLLFVQQTQLIR